MSQRNGHSKEFVIGAVVGSLLGGVAALITTPKTGKKLRDDLCEAYWQVSEKTHNLAERGRGLAKDIGNSSSVWAGRARAAVDDATGTVKRWAGYQEEEPTKDLLIGGLIGGVVGAALGFLLAPKSGEDFREELREVYEDLSEKSSDIADSVAKKGRAFAKSTRSSTSKWLALAQEFVDHISEEAEEKGEDLIDSVKDIANSKRVKEILDWAHVGYRMWETLQSKRKR